MSLLMALIIYALFLGIYGFALFSVVWHIKEYTTDMDLSKWLIRAFLTVIIFLTAASLILFFNIPFV